MDAWEWIRSQPCARGVVATKMDKLTRADRARHVREFETLFDMPVTLVSARTGEGLDELWKMIASLPSQRRRSHRHPRKNRQRKRRREAAAAPTGARSSHRPRPPPPAAPGPDDLAVGDEGDEHLRADQDRQGARDRRRHRHAQAGADLRDPARARREERQHLLGRRARDAARRLRLPARARLQLPARSRRHLRLALADPQVRPAHRRHRVRRHPAAEGRRALLRADQGRGDQLRAAREDEGEDLLREPHAALPAAEGQARDRIREPLGPRDGSADAARQGPARADRRAAPHRQDDAAAEHRQQHHQEPSRGVPDRAAHRRAAGRSHRHAALGQGRGHLLDLRRAGPAPRAGGRDGHRKGQAPRRAQEGRRHPARLDHAPRARLQHDRPGVGQGALGRRGQQRAAAAEAVLRRRAQHRGRRLADHRRHRAGRHRLAHGRSDLRGVQGHRQLGNPSRSQADRPPRVPVDRHQQERHAQGGAAAGEGRPQARVGAAQGADAAVADAKRWSCCCRR